mmetsp:Transcript_32970/g.57912  ORF Transcript_32970/g.57912 Transcript_32970/m.57912 type:complete len:321 (+) Transcript_32970:594-1556(+)
MEVVLYSYAHAVEPITVITKTWATLYQIDGFSEEPQKSYWSAAGDLPVVRFNRFVFPKEHIVDFLKQTYDPDTDLTAEERLKGELLEEFVLGRLHPAVMYSMWMDDAIPKDFFSPQGWWLWRIMSLPTSKLKYMREKTRVREYLAHQHEISSYREALFNADTAHKLLSEHLGQKQFFFSAEGRRDVPHSTDIVIFAYLVEELANLPFSSPIVSTLSKYPNLYEFVRRMESTLKLVIKGGLQKNSVSFKFVTDCGCSEIFTPKIYASPHTNDPEFFKKLRLSGAPGIKQQEVPNALSKKWQYYISGSGAILFTFFLLRGSS